MVVLMFKNLDIPDGFKHKSSDWQIAEDKYFKNIVAESRNDTTNLTSILFDVDLDPDKKYYARARVIMDYGPSDWSDIDIIQAEDLNKVDLDIDIPSVVATPEVTVDFPYDKVPPIMFTIKTSNMSTNSNAKHLSTDWFITDIDGNLVFTSLEDQTNLTSIFVDDVMLETDKFYRVKASHQSSSGDISELGERLIYVPDAKEIELASKFNTANVKSTGLIVNLKPVDNVEKVYVKVWMTGDNNAVLAYDSIEDTFSFVIPKDIFTSVLGKYLVEVQYEYINGEKSNIKYFPATVTG